MSVEHGERVFVLCDTGQRLVFIGSLKECVTKRAELLPSESSAERSRVWPITVWIVGVTQFFGGRA
jgi:hypothetical protein